LYLQNTGGTYHLRLNNGVAKSSANEVETRRAFAAEDEVFEIPEGQAVISAENDSIGFRWTNNQLRHCPDPTASSWDNN
jgi:hypothetical protein